MDYDGQLFAMQDSSAQTVVFVALFFAAFLALVGLAAGLTTMRRMFITADDAVGTDAPAPDVIGRRWVPVARQPPPATHIPHARFVTLVVRNPNDAGMMPLIIELKQWRMVLAVKLHVYYATGYRLAHQRLSRNGERLDDYRHLEDYGWQNGQCVELQLDILVSL